MPGPGALAGSDFSSALSATCVLCLLHSHATAEDLYLFPAVEKCDSTLIGELLREHGEFSVELRNISTMCDQLKGVESSPERIAGGKRLTLAVIDFFARYMTHLVLEEKELIPLLNRSLTDDQLISIRDAMSGHLSPDRFTGFMKWMLASLNPTELAKMTIEVTSQGPEGGQKRLSRRNRELLRAVRGSRRRRPLPAYQTEP